MSRFNRAHAFYRATRMHRADYAVARCLFVCPFVTLWYSVDTGEHILKFFLPSGSPTILVFPYQTGWQLTILRQELCGCSIWHSDEGLGRAAAPSRVQTPPRCTKCNSLPINGQYTNFILFDVEVDSPASLAVTPHQTKAGLLTLLRTLKSNLSGWSESRRRRQHGACCSFSLLAAEPDAAVRRCGQHRFMAS